MTKRKPEINPFQGALMEQGPNQELILGETIPEPSLAISYGTPGSYVDVAERAEFLVGALGAFGYRNQRRGFDLASNSPQYNAEIWRSYRERTPFVQAGAAANSERYLRTAKRELWHATGYAALRDTGLASDTQIDAEARLLWRRFSARYADPERKARRDTYKRELNRGVRLTRQIGERSVRAAA